MSPNKMVQDWVSRFNEADVDGLASLYSGLVLSAHSGAFSLYRRVPDEWIRHA